MRWTLRAIKVHTLFQDPFAVVERVWNALQHFAESIPIRLFGKFVLKEANDNGPKGDLSLQNIQVSLSTLLLSESKMIGHIYSK